MIHKPSRKVVDTRFNRQPASAGFLLFFSFFLCASFFRRDKDGVRFWLIFCIIFFGSAKRARSLQEVQILVSEELSKNFPIFNNID